MPNFEPGTYDLPSLLGKLSGKENPSQDFVESIRRWKELKATQIDLGPTEDNKFIRGIIHEQSAEKLRPFVEILSNSIDACLEYGVEKPKLEVTIRIKPDGSYAIEISDKGIGSGMTSEVFVQKYLPPSASTKGQFWSSSIGQMGVGANQQYGLLIREGDEILVTTTDETGHATLMGVKPKDNNLQATIAAGSVPSTQVQQGLDKQGTLTRITLSKETANEIGFTPNNLIAYLADRFGSYQQAELSVRVIGAADNVTQSRFRNDYMRLTPDEEYSRALEIITSRLQKSQTEANGRSEVVYQLTQEISDETHFIHEADLSSDYLVQDRAERYKTAALQVSRELSDTSLVYLSVLGVRFGEPLVIQGKDLPSTIDINLNYRIGQISESRSEIRLTEFDYLRLASLISSLEQREDIPLEIRLKIVIALGGFCVDLDKQSPNKLRYDINLTRKLEQTLSSLAQSADKSRLWPGELGALCQDDGAIVIPSKMVDEYVFDYETLGFRVIDSLQSDKGEVYIYMFPDGDKRPFLWTDQTLIINEHLFPYLLSEKESLRKADIVKVLAVQHNLRDAELSSGDKMPMKVSLRVVTSQQEQSRTYSREDYDHEMGVSKELAAEVKTIITELTEQVDNAESHWESWSLEEKQDFVLRFISEDHDTPDNTNLVTELGLTSMEEIDAFFPIFVKLMRKKFQETSHMHHFEMEMRHHHNGAQNRGEPLRSMFFLKKSELRKNNGVLWSDISKYHSIFDKSWLSRELFKADEAFYHALDSLNFEELENLIASFDSSYYDNVEELGKLLVMMIIENSPAFTELKSKHDAEVIQKLLEQLFVFESGNYDTYLFSEIVERFAEFTQFFYYYCDFGRGIDNTALKMLYKRSKGNLNRLFGALAIANQYNLDVNDIKKAERHMTRWLTDGQKALVTFLDESTQLVINDEVISGEIASHAIGNSQSVGEVVDPNSSELALRRILQNVNSVEPGLGGSVHEAIKNAVQAINRARGHGLGVSSQIVISDFMEVSTNQDQGKYGFGFRLEDKAGWADANEALSVLTTPGKGEGLHSVHFLTLLKEYDLVRVRATDRQGRTALIEYRRVIDKRQQKITDVRVSHVVVESSHEPGTVIEGVKWTEYPQADSSIFRTSIDHFARNVPREEAEIVFDNGDPEGELKNLNTAAETVLQQANIEGFGTASIIRTSREWYSPEVAIDHVPVRFDLINLIKSNVSIPQPYQELLINSGFTLNIANPQIAIIRSTLEFKDQVVAQRVLGEYLSENWQSLFTELSSRGKIDLARGGYLTGDSWYDSALFGPHSQSDYQRRLQDRLASGWMNLTDKTEIGTYLYFQPLVDINGSRWSIAQIVEDQYKPIQERQLQANDIPLSILLQIRTGKERIQKDETKSANDTVEYVDAPPAIRQVLNGIHAVVQPHVRDTDDIEVRTHTGSFRGLGNRAFHVGGVVSFNLDTMTHTIERAGQGNFDSLGEVITTSAHELEHGKRREDESPFSHTQDFYSSVETTLLQISPEQIADLL